MRKHNDFLLDKPAYFKWNSLLRGTDTQTRTAMIFYECLKLSQGDPLKAFLKNNERL